MVSGLSSAAAYGAPVVAASLFGLLFEVFESVVTKCSQGAAILHKSSLVIHCYLPKSGGQTDPTIDPCWIASNKNS